MVDGIKSVCFFHALTIAAVRASACAGVSRHFVGLLIKNQPLLVQRGKNPFDRAVKESPHLRGAKPNNG